MIRILKEKLAGLTENKDDLELLTNEMTDSSSWGRITGRYGTAEIAR